jgi:hypothetical protein
MARRAGRPSVRRARVMAALFSTAVALYVVAMFLGELRPAVWALIGIAGYGVYISHRPAGESMRLRRARSRLGGGWS